MAAQKIFSTPTSATGQWSVKQVVAICAEGEEERFSQGSVSILDPSAICSVADAVDKLNSGSLDCLEGYCIVFSERNRKYHLLYRKGLKDVGLAACGAVTARVSAEGGVTVALSCGAGAAVPRSATAAAAASAAAVDLLAENPASAGLPWTTKQVMKLGDQVERVRIEGHAQILDPAAVTSVAGAVDALNAGDIEVGLEGVCAVHSSTRQCYYLLYKRGMREVALAKREMLDGGGSPTAASPQQAHRSLRTSPERRSLSANSFGPLSTAKRDSVESVGMSGPWAQKQVVRLGGTGSEWRFEGRAPLVDATKVTSVAMAVDLLNRGEIDYPDGFCVVFSSSRQAYHLIYRSGQREEALAAVFCTEDAWAPKQLARICSEGEEEAFDGRVFFMDRSIFSSVADAVRALNKDDIMCPDGYCVVFSSSKGCYYLLWRVDKREAALRAAGLDGEEALGFPGPARRSRTASGSQELRGSLSWRS